MKCILATVLTFLTLEQFLRVSTNESRASEIRSAIAKAKEWFEEQQDLHPGLAARAYPGFTPQNWIEVGYLMLGVWNRICTQDLPLELIQGSHLRIGLTLDILYLECDGEMLCWGNPSENFISLEPQSGPKVLDHSGVFIRDFPVPHCHCWSTLNSKPRLLNLMLLNLVVRWPMGAAIVRPPNTEYTQSIGVCWEKLPKIVKITLLQWIRSWKFFHSVIFTIFSKYLPTEKNIYRRKRS